MQLSILIATLEQRRALFNRIQEKVCQQIDSLGLTQQLELLWLADDGSHRLGSKRNELISRARGDFVCFVDDDDDVSDHYVELICQAIRAQPEVDCIGISGVVTFRGKHPMPLVYSLEYRAYSSKDGVYQRPPFHFNPIRRSIVQRYPFQSVNYGEDAEWAFRLVRHGAIRTQRLIEEPLYFYRSRRAFWVQQLLDVTEVPRHTLRLTWADALRIRYTFLKRVGRI